MRNKIFILTFILFALFIAWNFTLRSSLSQPLENLKLAYPDFIKSVNSEYITWTDGTTMPVHMLADQLEQSPYFAGMPKDISTFSPQTDPGRIRYAHFFQKMYGDSHAAVKDKLTIVYWMPGIFGNLYPLEVTRVNSVDKKLVQVSNEFEALVRLHPKFKVYLEKPDGMFYWRTIAKSDQLSTHSYGIAMDLNTDYSNYWQWDLEKQNLPILESTPLTYVNQIPWEIVLIFEKYGFIWGGKWYHYDTMHFEYRPELLM